ncbi:MAG: pilus assembly protein PilP [Polyangiaceae bacterium]|nr:pilus assembly protein PilP [Polyangiaceae bacterium]
MSALGRTRVGAALAVGLACLGVACEEEIVQGTDPPPADSAAAASASVSATASATPKLEVQEQEFAESDRSRDPFRSFADTFVEEARGKKNLQRQVVLDQYSLEELKLVGIVTGNAAPVAMLVDPTGKGHVIRRGQFIGRAETVPSPNQSGATYEMNWRVDRIRDGDVVLIREDPQNPDVPTATRVIPLRPEGALLEPG